MGSIKRKIKNNSINIKLSMRFECPICNFKKTIPREIISSIKPDEFTNNKIFVCSNCNVRMNPIEVIADF